MLYIALQLVQLVRFSQLDQSQSLFATHAPINVNPVGGGGEEYGQGVGIWQILKFFHQIPQGGKGKVNQKCQKSFYPRGKI